MSTQPGFNALVYRRMAQTGESFAEVVRDFARRSAAKRRAISERKKQRQSLGVIAPHARDRRWDNIETP